MVKENKSTTSGYQRSAVGCLIRDKKSKSKRGHNSEKMHFEVSSLIVWIALWMLNTYSEFQIFSVITELLQNVSVFARQRRRQGYSNTSGFLRKTAELISRHFKKKCPKTIL